MAMSGGDVGDPVSASIAGMGGPEDFHFSAGGSGGALRWE
jgi:hypothetical protein